jgi:uncharacterized protein (DUF1330 family)
MAAYVIVEIEVLNAETYETYKQMVPASLANFQGKFLVRGGSTESLEGDWSPKRFVMLEFPSFDLAKSWWASSDYAKAKKVRQASANTKMIVVEGV